MRILRFLPLLALLAACSDSTGPGGAVRMTAMVNGDAPPTGDNVSLTIENRSGRTVQMALCSETRVTLAIDRRVGGAWEDFGGDVCFALYQPVDLAPGASRTETRAVHEAGQYRFELRVWYKDGVQSSHTAYSGAFDVQ